MNVLQFFPRNDWEEQVSPEFEQAYFRELTQFITKEYEEATIYPHVENLFQAFRETPYHKVKVVILGQDPYHGDGQAHGLSFSVQKGVPLPPSLRNMFKELETDLGIPIPEHGELTQWAKQGVLLLNTVLSVREGEANSHRNKGWEKFTDHVIGQLNQKKGPIIFLLWGKPAQEKKRLLNLNKHYVIEAPHPSPLSAYRGYFGSKPYSKTNELLRQTGQQEINWTIE